MPFTGSIPVLQVREVVSCGMDLDTEADRGLMAVGDEQPLPQEPADYPPGGFLRETRAPAGPSPVHCSPETYLLKDVPGLRA